MRTKLLGIVIVIAGGGLAASSVACGGAEATSHGVGDAGGSPEAAPRDTGSPDSSDAGARGCGSTSDCPPMTMSVGTAFCAGPYDWPPACLPCAEPPVCANDSQCDAGTVCRQSSVPTACGQMQGSPYCYPPCETDGDCPPTQTCSSGSCAPRTCADCPAYFSCTNGVCTDKACTSDSDCPTGHCVNGSCAGTLGTCMMSPGCA